jgi:hypothetical protein
MSSFRATLYHFIESFPLLGVGRMEHVCFHRFLMERPANAQLQPGKILISQVFHDGRDPAVSARASPLGQANAPKGKVKVIMDDEHLFWQDLEIPQHLAYSLTTAVHIGERFEKKHLLSTNQAGAPAGWKFSLF